MKDNKLTNREKKQIKQIPTITERKAIRMAFPERYVHAEILIFPDGVKLVDFGQTPEQRDILFSISALKKIIKTAERTKF